MRKYIFIVLSIAVYNGANCQSWQSVYKEAEAAYQAKDYSLFYLKMKAALEIHPYHQGLLYQLGIASTLNRNNEEAFSSLEKAILINADCKLEGVPDLASLADDSRWGQLLELQKKWKQTVIQSQKAFTIPDRQLHAEGIDYDPGRKTFYVGSIHQRKIVQINEQHQVTDFIKSGAYGMCSVFGVKVDSKANVLWVCSSPMTEMENYDTLATSAVFKFELPTGNLIKKYELPVKYKAAIFGDLILSSSGTPFISDSKNNIIWTIAPGQEELSLYFTSPEFWNIQGIAFESLGKGLFVSDYVKGVYKIDPALKLQRISNSLSVSMKGIDGLYFYEGSLIAIQNGVSPLRVVRYYLNADRVTDFKIIDSNHPDFNEPTLGVIVGKQFYYIANSQWGGYDSTGKIKPSDQLQDIVILKGELR